MLTWGARSILFYLSSDTEQNFKEVLPNPKRGWGWLRYCLQSAILCPYFHLGEKQTLSRNISEMIPIIMVQRNLFWKQDPIWCWLAWILTVQSRHCGHWWAKECTQRAAISIPSMGEMAIMLGIGQLKGLQQVWGGFQLCLLRKGGSGENFSCWNSSQVGMSNFS